MAELLISYAANEIMKKLQSVVTDQITRAWGLEDDLEKLRGAMGRLQSLLQKAQNVLAREDDESIKHWVEKLQKVVYAAADVVDEFHYEILRREVEIKSQLKWKVREFVSCNNPIYFRVKMAAKVKEVSESLADMEKQAPIVLLTMIMPAITDATERGVVLSNQPKRATDSTLVERPIGRTKEAQRIINMLQVSSDDVPRLNVISIVGFGGIGKTTLAQLVSEEAKTKKLFDEVMWVCVSESFDIQKIMGEMLQKLDKTTGGLSNMDAIVDNLQQNLEDKRILLFLDDVWNKELDNWKNLKRRLENICDKNGNFVIVTTRGHDVANIMGTQTHHMVELEQLSETECWSIIKGRIAENEDISHDMETIGMEIAKKCGGVPLAAKVIGGVLCSRKNKDDWLSVQRSQMWNEEDEGKKILGVLKLSFDHLPPSQKLCFAYCSIFPKDFVFEKAQLIQLWMAENFLETTLRNGGTREKLMEDVGDEYFHSLLNNSFFQDAQVDYYGDIVGCKMHDLLHDLALSISKFQRLKCGSDCIQTSNGRRLNCSCHHESKVQGILESSKEKTRNIHCLFCRVDISPMLSNFKRLRSLDMSDANLKNLPAAIRKLKHLRYLDISKNESIQVLPKSITKLYHLQTLRVFQCESLMELPTKIVHLVNLRHIGFDDKRLMPLKVGCLTNLQTLPFFVVGQQKGQTIDELEGLKELRGELMVYNLENVRDKGEAERAKMKEKKLSILGLLWMEVKENEVEKISSNRESNHEDVMEGLGAPKNTQNMRVDWYMGKQFPKWMSELRELMVLTLNNCKRCVTLPTLGHLPNLKILAVEGMDCMKVIGSEFYGENNNTKILFPSLEEFFVREMKSLVEWVAPKGIEIFPKLCALEIENCPNLTSFPLSQSTSSAIAMRLVYCLSDEYFSAEILCSIDFKSLKQLSIRGCPKLTFGGVAFFWDFPFFSKYHKFIKNLAVHSNELGECWKTMEIDVNIEIIGEFFKSLEALEIFRVEKKLSVEAFHGLSCLEHLLIHGCPNIESIPILLPLTSLKHLKITKCKLLVSIPSLSSLTSLQYLGISCCDCLESIPSLSSLTSLKHLKINYCKVLRSIPCLSSLTSLERLQMTGCRGLELFPSLSSLSSLKHLEISDWDDLESILSFSSLIYLNHLKINNCNRLESILSLSSLASLEHLEISHFDHLESIPAQIKSFTSLKELIVKHFREIVSIDDDIIGSLTQLKKLEWGGFSKELDELPGLNFLRLLTSLEIVTIHGWDKLTSLPHQLQYLTSITRLEIWSFNGVESLPDWFCKLSSLQTLSIKCCENLKNLTIGMQRLSKLSELEIWGCPLLAGRCDKDTGPEWSNISHIPHIKIG